MYRSCFYLRNDFPARSWLITDWMITVPFQSAFYEGIRPVIINSRVCLKTTTIIIFLSFRLTGPLKDYRRPFIRFHNLVSVISRLYGYFLIHRVLDGDPSPKREGILFYLFFLPVLFLYRDWGRPFSLSVGALDHSSSRVYSRIKTIRFVVVHHFYFMYTSAT